MRLMNLARRYGFALLEDDYDFDYHFTSNPLLPLASLDTSGHIIYVGSFCKSIAPGIRIGFMVAPEVVINEAAALRKLIDRQGEHVAGRSDRRTFEQRRYFPAPQKVAQDLSRSAWIIPAGCFGSSWENI